MSPVPARRSGVLITAGCPGCYIEVSLGLPEKLEENFGVEDLRGAGAGGGEEHAEVEAGGRNAPFATIMFDNAEQRECCIS